MLKKFRQLNDRSMIMLLILIAVWTHIGWLFDFSVFTSGDWWHIGVERYRDFAHFSPIWITEGLGTTSAVPPFYFIRFLEGLTTLAGFSFVLTEKLFFFLPIIFGSSLGAYLFLRQYFKPTLAFVGAIVFSFNTAMLFNYAGALTIAAAYALTPVALYLFRQYLFRPKEKKLLVGTAVTFALVAAYEQRIVLLVLAMAIGLFIFHAAWSEKRFAYIKERFWPMTKLLAIFVALHAFWLVPYVVNAKTGVTFSDLLSRQLFESFSNVQNSMTLFHPFWTGGRPATFVPQPIPMYMWLVPIAAFGGFLMPRRFRAAIVEYKEVLYWGLVALVGIFLVKQVNEPFTSVYPWLYNNLPGAAAFREASKFYLLNALGYAVLIPFTLATLQMWFAARWRGSIRRIRLWRAAYIVAVGTVTLLFLGQAGPLLTGEFRTLYTARSMPQDYKVLNEFIQNQPDYFRVMWMPVNSRWGLQTDRHPSVSASQMATGTWLNSLKADTDDPFPTLRDKSAALVSDASSNDVLDRASVKYVVVPLRDSANEDDFFRKYGDDRQFYIEQLDKANYLKKIDTGTKDILVYENQNYQQHISSFSALQSFDTGNDDSTFDRFYDLVTTKLKAAFNFVVPDPKKPDQNTYPKTDIQDVFQTIRPEDVQNGRLSKTVKAGENSELYIEGNSRRISYKIENGTIRFYGQPENSLQINGVRVQPSQPKTELDYASLLPGMNYLLAIGGKPSDLATAPTEKDLGVIDTGIALYAVGANTLPNPSFEEGLWQQKVGDCNNYDQNPGIGMRRDAFVFKDGKASLQFESWKHTACTDSAPIPVTAASYLLSFDYQVVGGQAVGYEIHFDDPAKTVVKKAFDTDHRYWQNYRAVVDAPAGAKSYTVRLLGYSDYLVRGSTLTNYDNVQMLSLNKRADIAASKPGLQKAPLPAGKDSVVSYVLPGQSRGENLLENGDFSEGLWQKKPGDCNNYDENPSIGMKLHTRSKGSKSGGPGGEDKALELSARRHAACTSKGSIPAQEFRTYLLSFDYQSPNARIAHYRVEFNDPARTTIEGEANIKGTGWQSYSTQVQAPANATNMKVVLFAFESAYKVETIINRFDTISVKETPPVTGKYYLVTQPGQNLFQPRNVTFNAKSATAKTVTIEGATTPFYLEMSEAYNPLWRLSLDEHKRPVSWLPWMKSPAVPDKQHFKLNDFANGWYIDPAELCKKESFNCLKLADGSYTINLVAEYTAQRWFNIGAIISALSLIGCAVYIGHKAHGWKKRRNLWK